MLEINFWKSNIKGIINYYLKALPKKDQLEEGEEDKGDWLKFVMDNKDNFEKVKEKLTPFGLAQIVKQATMAGAFAYKKKPESFFIRETYVKDDKKGKAKKDSKKKKKDEIFS